MIWGTQRDGNESFHEANTCEIYANTRKSQTWRIIHPLYNFCASRGSFFGTYRNHFGKGF